MVAGLRFVPRRRAKADALLDGHGAEVLLKDAVPVMAPGVGAQSDADGYGAAQLPGLAENVFHADHNRAGLVGVFLLRRDAEALAVEGAGLFQLHGDDLRVRRRPGEVLGLPPRGHGGQEGAVALLVPLRDQGVGVLGGQGGVDVRLAVLPAQQKSGRRIPVGGLVVDVAYLTGAVFIAEDVLGVVDAGVHKAHQHPPSFQIQIGLAVDLGDARRLQGGPVQQPQHHGGGAEEGGAQGLLQVVKILLLDIAQDVALGQHLSHHHLVGAPGVVEKGVGGPGDEIHGIRRLDEGQGLR